MRDQVSWAFIGNFTFLVGVAVGGHAVIPAYVYHWYPIKEVDPRRALRHSALAMSLLYILCDLGRPDRFVHLVPPGTPNWPATLTGMRWC